MNNQIAPALSIIELEERFETTVAALDSSRCGDRKDCGCPSKPSAS